MARHLAKRFTRSVVIDVDQLREMVLTPRAELWEGTDGPEQHLLGVDNAVAMAHNFLQAQFDVIIVDAVTNDSLARYRSLLADVGLWVVRLLPDERNVTTWILSRPEVLSRAEVSWMYDQQAALDGYDDEVPLDDANAAVEWLHDHWVALT
jgi:hypothetical protein